MNRSILMLEPDEDDRYITQTVVDENNYKIKLQFVNNSSELFAYLVKCIREKSALPSLILLNYHAFPMNAVEILKGLKEDQKYKHIPVVVLSGSVDPQVVRDCYTQGASTFIRKPSLSEETSNKISTFIRYWFETAELI